jgi:DNA ligase-1
MLAGDLPRVAAVALREGEPGLAAIGLEVLRPVQPMLASTAASVAEAVTASGLSSVEWKLDGARVQAHRLGSEVRLFTRNLNEITGRLPGVVDAVRALPAEAIVLDGEVLGVGDDERPGMFQDTMSRFGRHDGSGASLGVWFFDCLHIDGRDLVDRPLTERREALERVAAGLEVPSIVTDDPDTATAFLDEALASGHEGVMVKAASSLYEAGRRGQAWRKIKPVRTLDLVVLAAEWGHGRRRGWLSNLHLGARDPDGGFVMVGKTFKGLTDAVLTWQTAELLARETSRSGIAVYVRPELVVEIGLDGVQVSTRYPGGVALRFARVKRYRDDKNAADADTIDAVRSLLSK